MSEEYVNISSYVKNNQASVNESPFNDVDGLVMSQVSRIDFSNCGIDINSGQTMTIEQLYRTISCQKNWKTNDNEETRNLLELMANSDRYKNMVVGNFVRNPVANNIEGFSSVGYDKRYEQFEAVTITYEQDGKKVNYISFAPTDGSNKGWIEDALMITGKTTQAQQDSLSYLNMIGRQLDGDVVGGGHSKGANDFEYAYLFCDDDVRKKITAGYMYDGPGLAKSVVARSGYYKDFINKVKDHTFFPRDSLVGQLLYEIKGGTFIETSVDGVNCHDAFYWKIR